MLGPVFTADLRCNSRRPRMLIVRTVFALALLLMLWTSYQTLLHPIERVTFGQRGMVRQPITHGTVLADFGSHFSFSFMIIQFVFLLLVGPAYVAGAVAEEKQRGTLEYLLATDLTSLEIILGKYFSRFLLLMHFVLIGVPVLAITLLIGGVSVELMLGMFLGTLGCAASLTALAVLLSVLSKRGRDALIRTYLIVGVVCLVYFVIEELLGWTGFPAFITRNGLPFLPDVFAALETFNPLRVAADLRGLLQQDGEVGLLPITKFGRCFLGHAALAGVLLLLAAGTLRSKHQRQIDRQVIEAKRLRDVYKPDIDDRDPMFWKEQYVEDGSWRLGARVVRGLKHAPSVAFFTAWFALFMIVVLCLVLGALESTNRGWAKPPPDYLIWPSVGMFGLALVVTAIRTSSGIAAEKTRQTWDALLASPLRTESLLTCRLYGGFRSARWLFLCTFLALLPIAWYVRDLSLTSYPYYTPTSTAFVSSVGHIMLLALASAGYFWFTIALAAYFSLRTASVLGNVLATLAVVLTLNGFPFLVRVLFGGEQLGSALSLLLYHLSRPDTSAALVGVGLLAAGCVVGYYYLPRARWLIDVVKWVGYLVGLNVMLITMLCGLVFSFGVGVPVAYTSMFFSPVATFYWTVVSKIAIRESDWTGYYGLNPTGMLMLSSIFFALLGLFLYVWSLHKLRRTCGRVEYSRRTGIRRSPGRVTSAWG